MEDVDDDYLNTIYVHIPHWYAQEILLFEIFSLNKIKADWVNLKINMNNT